MKQIFNSILYSTDKEVALFRKLAKILALNHRVTFIEETHQNYVSFDSVTIGKTVKREISDLWIIMYSPDKRQARMTFLQAKFQPLNWWRSNCFFFNGDFFQHELLSKRPQIKSSQFPENILSYTDNSSIGSFGVFYQDCYGNIDLAFAVADSIQCATSIPVTSKLANRTMKFPDLGIKKFIVELKHKDSIIATHSIDVFTTGLLNMMIGADFLGDSSILSFVKKTLKYCANNNTEVKYFLNFIEELDISIDNNVRGTDNIPNIILINIDGEAQY